MSEQDLFLATVAHELRTPLTVLRGTSETLLHRWDELTDEQRRELVTTVATRTDGLHRLVEQLLLGWQAGAGLPLVPRPLDLTEVAAAGVEAVAQAAAAHVLTFRAEGPVRVAADPVAVEAVLGQLLENAVKYSPGGGAVDVTVGAEGEVAVLRVADRGTGIAAADVERVFERFERAGAVGTGAGLGLWIVRRYVQAMAGTVTAAPRQGGGTVLAVRLPLSR